MKDLIISKDELYLYGAGAPDEKYIQLKSLPGFVFIAGQIYEHSINPDSPIERAYKIVKIDKENNQVRLETIQDEGELEKLELDVSKALIPFFG